MGIADQQAQIGVPAHSPAQVFHRLDGLIIFFSKKIIINQHQLQVNRRRMVAAIGVHGLLIHAGTLAIYRHRVGRHHAHIHECALLFQVCIQPAVFLQKFRMPSLPNHGGQFADALEPPHLSVSLGGIAAAGQQRGHQLLHQPALAVGDKFSSEVIQKIHHANAAGGVAVEQYIPIINPFSGQPKPRLDAVGIADHAQELHAKRLQAAENICLHRAFPTGLCIL